MIEPPLSGAGAAPRVRRDGTVALPSTWNCLAHAVSDEDSPAARELALQVLEASEQHGKTATSASEGQTARPAGESDIDLPRYVGRSVRRYRLEVEIVDTGDWRDIQAEVADAVCEITPGAAYAVDLTEETLLVPDGNGEPGSRCA